MHASKPAMIQLHTVRYIVQYSTYWKYENKEGRGQDERKEEGNGQGGSTERGRNGKWNGTGRYIELKDKKEEGNGQEGSVERGRKGKMERDRTVPVHRELKDQKGKNGKRQKQKCGNG
jgi:hypothetical protein